MGLQHRTASYWTIHGLWPNGLKDNPAFCQPDNKFDPEKIQALQASLKKYWFSSTSEDSLKFWSHEWSKHGTCAASVPGLDGQLNYFNTALHLAQTMNATKFFENAKIFPNKSKPLDQRVVITALSSQLNSKQPRITCLTNKQADLPFLKEIHICLSKKLKLIDCPHKDGGCGHHRVLYF